MLAANAARVSANGVDKPVPSTRLREINLRLSIPCFLALPDYFL
jgi:hypothetical protein